MNITRITVIEVDGAVTRRASDVIELRDARHELVMKSDFLEYDNITTMLTEGYEITVSAEVSGYKETKSYKATEE